MPDYSGRLDAARSGSCRPSGSWVGPWTDRSDTKEGLSASLIRAVCDAAGIRRVRLHDLRHTCATILLAQGVDTRTIMEILGHSTIVLTMNTYAHVLPEHQATALDKLEKGAWGTRVGRCRQP
jgi:integrase